MVSDPRGHLFPPPHKGLALHGSFVYIYSVNPLLRRPLLHNLHDFQHNSHIGSGGMLYDTPYPSRSGRNAPIPELTDTKNSRNMERKGATEMETKKKKGTPPPRYDEAFKAGAVRMVTEQGRQPA